MKMKHLFLVMTAMAVFFSCSNHNSGEEEIVRKVKVSLVGKDSTVMKKVLTGVVKEAREVNLAFRVAGPVQKIHVQPGDYVTKGRLIAEMDPRDYRIQVNVAEAQFNQVSAETKRVKELYNRKSVTQAEYEKAIAGEKMVEAQLKHARDQLNDTKLYAPFSGYIQKVNYENSELVNTGMTVATLLDVDRYEVETGIPASLFNLRDHFMSYSLKAGDTEELPLKLESFDKKAGNNELFRFYFTIGSSSGKLDPGMDVTVNIYVANKNKNPLYLPLKSVFYSDGKSFVWIYNPADSKVTKREVVTDGLLGDENIRVVSGLSGSELVVVAGVSVLHEGQKVEVLKKVSKTNVGGLL